MPLVKPDSTGQSEKFCAEEKVLVLYNDDFNEFDFVIDCLIKVCNYEPEPAFQCALIAHNNGKCSINSGLYEELKPQHDALSALGLTASIN